MDRFQAHFIVRTGDGAADTSKYVARTVLRTHGHFASKTVESVSWDGPGALAAKLATDDELNGMIAKQSVKDATIYVEPTDGGAVRIRRGKWEDHLAFGITKDLFDICDRIAGHVRSV